MTLSFNPNQLKLSEIQKKKYPFFSQLLRLHLFPPLSRSINIVWNTQGYYNDFFQVWFFVSHCNNCVVFPHVHKAFQRKIRAPQSFKDCSFKKQHLFSFDSPPFFVPKEKRKLFDLSIQQCFERMETLRGLKSENSDRNFHMYIKY